jgi:hypothetical protein
MSRFRGDGWAGDAQHAQLHGQQQHRSGDADGRRDEREQKAARRARGQLPTHSVNLAARAAA